MKRLLFVLLLAGCGQESPTDFDHQLWLSPGTMKVAVVPLAVEDTRLPLSGDADGDGLTGAFDEGWILERNPARIVANCDPDCDGEESTFADFWYMDAKLRERSGGGDICPLPEPIPCPS